MGSVIGSLGVVGCVGCVGVVVSIGGSLVTVGCVAAVVAGTLGSLTSDCLVGSVELVLDASVGSVSVA